MMNRRTVSFVLAIVGVGLIMYWFLSKSASTRKHPAPVDAAPSEKTGSSVDNALSEKAGSSMPSAEPNGPRKMVAPDSAAQQDVVELGPGFFFLDAEYIEAPYSITAEEGWVLVNGRRVRKIIRWPIKIESKVKPVIPEGVFENAKGFADLRIPGTRDSWHFRMARWINRTYQDHETRRQKMKELYSSLGFVKSVSFPRDREMEVVLKNGMKEVYGLSSTRGGSPSKEDLLARLERVRSRFENGLKKNETFLVFTPGLELSFGKTKAAKDLGLMVEVLESNRTKDEKLDILCRMAIIPDKQGRSIKMLVTKFKATPQLKQRIEALQKELGVKPRKLEDLPKTSHNERVQRIIEQRIRVKEEAKRKKTEKQ